MQRPDIRLYRDRAGLPGAGTLIKDFDVIVLGTGAAGMTAAVAAHEGGARVIIDVSTVPCAAAAQLSVEQHIFDAMAGSPPRLHLWQPLPALIATLAEAVQPGFEQAATRAKDRGLPVFVRRSGGGAVCLGPGSLVVSHFYDSPHNDIGASYRWFAELLIEAAAALDISLRAQQVTGAYCDGRFDLASEGRKVGGIAQRRRMHDGKSLVWIHAVLAVDARSLRHPEAVTEFYADLGSPRVADPRSTTTLSQCRSTDAAECDLMSQVSDAIVQAFKAQAQSEHHLDRPVTWDPRNPPRSAA